MHLDTTRIILHKKTELSIYINTPDPVDGASASILGESGELIRMLPLAEGLNSIDINEYINKNYAVRVVNGKNTIVQAI